VVLVLVLVLALANVLEVDNGDEVTRLEDWVITGRTAGVVVLVADGMIAPVIVDESAYVFAGTPSLDVMAKFALLK